MSLDTNDEILQDFIVEASEILELLSEQLVELEQRPDDNELLNAIFRGFHTVKGGAGFLSLTNLVSVCHVAENVFDLLRQGKLQVNPDIMDVCLRALDTVNAMFEEINSGEFPSPACSELLEQLEKITTKDIDFVPVEEPVSDLKPELSPKPKVEVVSGKDLLLGKDGDAEITEDEFEQLLDAIHGKTPSEPSKTTNSSTESDNITEEEFEQILDKIDNKESESASKSSSRDEILTAAYQGGDEITDDEFENLLDKLNGSEPKTSDVKPVEHKPETATDEKTQFVANKEPQPVKELDKKHPKESNIAAETTVRVDTARLDEIMNMVGELVLVRNRLVKLRGDSSDESLVKAVSNLDVVTGDLQMAVMKTRMQPIKKVFGRFPRVVRDLARSLQKEVLLEMIGEETDLDKNLVEALSDPLVHLVRNSVDHGIENPDEREKNGKDRTGTILLSAQQEGDHILLSIKDDGKGMDPDALRKIAVDKGVLDYDAAARLDDHECYNLIFMPGFSTKTEISDISGRGVGMDVVKTKITQLNGSIEIDSKLGEGSTIKIKVPLTLAILPTLMIKVGLQTFALPLTCVNEIFNFDSKRTNIVDGQLVTTVRGKAVPLFYLNKWLNCNSDCDKDSGHVVIVTVGTNKVGFIVDSLLGQEEVVIKALGEMLQGTAGMAGATITGDGKIAMIIDVPSLLNRYA